MDQLVQALRRGTSGRPVAIVVEESNPITLLELLKAGASDFFIPPLRAIDVFPRLTRLLEQSTGKKPWSRRSKRTRVLSD